MPPRSMAEDDQPKHDLERAVALRQAALERAGYDARGAGEIARRLDIDLQQAVSLPRAGFPPEVAYEMLVSGSRPVF